MKNEKTGKIRWKRGVYFTRKTTQRVLNHINGSTVTSNLFNSYLNLHITFYDRKQIVI